MLAELYLMVMAKVIKPAHLFDKDQAKLSHMMSAVPLLVLPSACCYLGGYFIFVQFGNIGLMENFL